jgi:hypothetical protein
MHWSQGAATTYPECKRVQAAAAWRHAHIPLCCPHTCSSMATASPELMLSSMRASKGPRAGANASVVRSSGADWKGVRKTSGTGAKSTSHSSRANSVAQMPLSL